MAGGAPQREARQRKAPQPLCAQAEHGEAAEAEAKRAGTCSEASRQPGAAGVAGPAAPRGGVGWGGVRGTLLRARGGLDGWRALPDPVPTQLRRDGTCRRPLGQKGEFLGVREVFRPSGRGAPGARSSNPTSALGRALRPWPGTWTALGLGFRDRRLPGMTVPSWRQD